jgi:hypothetical protein
MLYQREINGVLNGLMGLKCLFLIREARCLLALTSALIVIAVAVGLRAEYYPLAPWESLWGALSIVDAVRFVFINVVLVALLWLTLKIVGHEINPRKF